MIQVVIFGNSGSGKFTLARSYAKIPNVKPLDLDDIAWKSHGIREDIEKSIQKLRSFTSDNSDWVIEGCYGSLIQKQYWLPKR